MSAPRRDHVIQDVASCILVPKWPVLTSVSKFIRAKKNSDFTKSVAFTEIIDRIAQVTAGE
jgi:hypothetical protein